MDAPALTPDEVRELADLRSRAYGPHPDIGPDGVARMEQLEAARRFPLTRVSAVDRGSTRIVAVPARSVSEEASAPMRSSADGDDDDATDGEPLTVRLPRRRWIAMAVAAAVVVAGIWGVSQWVGPQPDVTLGPVVSVDGETRLGVIEAQALRAFGVDTDGIREYDSYYSLRTWVSTASNGHRCLAIYAGSHGPAGVSCTPRGLDPTVDVVIYDGTPDDIARGLPTGSVIRYVLSGDRVQVWERTADTDL
ncbi:hypothetical protein ACFXP7_08565 [Microbacterium sp. P06]|uniref:hypothetical protein n=1 Tax=Microbacterium sp. P06 TaxID=3366949 RepID=UPI003746BD88